MIVSSEEIRVYPSQWTYTHIHTNMSHTYTHHIDTHNTHTRTVCYKTPCLGAKEAGTKFSSADSQNIRRGRPSSDHNIVSLVLKVQISMTCRVVPAHHNQFVCSCRSQRLSVLPCDCICVHMCMCVPVCACVCVSALM